LSEKEILKEILISLVGVENLPSLSDITKDLFKESENFYSCSQYNVTHYASKYEHSMTNEQVA